MVLMLSTRGVEATAWLVFNPNVCIFCQCGSGLLLLNQLPNGVSRTNYWCYINWRSWQYRVEAESKLGNCHVLYMRGILWATTSTAFIWPTIKPTGSVKVCSSNKMNSTNSNAWKTWDCSVGPTPAESWAVYVCVCACVRYALHHSTAN